MKLCLQSPLPLDELESYAKTIFNAIPAREGLTEPKTNPFLTKSTGFLPVEAPQLVKYVPINDEITLDFWFTLPSVMMDFDSSPQSQGSEWPKISLDGIQFGWFIKRHIN